MADRFVGPDGSLGKVLRDAHIAGLKEALESVYGFAGKRDGVHQGSGIGPAWDAIRARIAELEKGSQ